MGSGSGAGLGLGSLDGRGVRLRWSTAQVRGCCAGQECWARRGLSVGDRGSA